MSFFGNFFLSLKLFLFFDFISVLLEIKITHLIKSIWFRRNVTSLSNCNSTVWSVNRKKACTKYLPCTFQCILCEVLLGSLLSCRWKLNDSKAPKQRFYMFLNFQWNKLQNFNKRKKFHVAVLHNNNRVIYWYYRWYLDLKPCLWVIYYRFLHISPSKVYDDYSHNSIYVHPFCSISQPLNRDGKCKKEHFCTHYVWITILNICLFYSIAFIKK